jgi:8-oxo-dGTP diphosphatase
MNEFPKVGVACFVWKDDKFLMGKRFGAHGEGTWSIPGGHLEFGESWEDAARREVLEETGMEITNLRFVAVTNDIFNFEQKHYITIWLAADWLANEPVITEPDKYVDQQWCDFGSLPSPLFEPCWQNLRLQRPDLFNK